MADIATDPVDEPANTWHDVANPLAAVLFVVVLLAVDELNPVKILCSYTGYFQGITAVVITQGHIASVAALMLVSLAVHQKERLVYYLARTFFRCTFNNMFFSSIEIVGAENLPKSGPVILTGNHNNQFVDGVILLSNCDRQVSFMIAQKSWNRPFVGSLAKAFHCIPVSRPQDIAYRGAGTVLRDGTSALRGEGTAFMKEVKPGDLVDITGESKAFKVKEVSSDALLLLDRQTVKADEPSKYKVQPKVNQSAMFDAVFDALRRGQCLGIFPEGGSHDRTDLLPLKAGVAIIALDARHKHHMHVPIVPVGLNYFKGHRFGGRVVVEFGPPIVVPEQIYAKYESDRHTAVEDLLQLVATGMRGTIVPTPDYSTLQQIYMARRLYVPDGLKLSAEQTMDLNRRFAIGLKKVLELRRSIDGAPVDADAASESSAGVASQSLSRSGSFSLDPDVPFKAEDIDFIDTFKAEVEDYMSTLKRLGLRDHQVRQIGWWGVSDLVGRLFYLGVTMLVGAIPQLLFNLPIVAFAGRWAVREQKKALAASSVKIAARDVLMSYKVIYVLMLVPILYIVYGTLFVVFFRCTTTTNVLIILMCPLFAFLGMKASDQGFRVYTDIVPLVLRFFPASREEQDRLPERRARLQKKLLLAVEKFGPLIGDIYKKKPVNWNKEIVDGWYTNAVAREPKDAECAASPTSGGPSPAAGAASPAGGAAAAPEPAAAAPELAAAAPEAADGGLSRRAAAGADKDGAD